MSCFMHALLEGRSASWYQTQKYIHSVGPVIRMFTCVCGIEADHEEFLALKITRRKVSRGTRQIW